MASSVDTSLDPFTPLPTKQTSALSTQVLEQPVEFVQSLELVQTTVCAVVSTVASLRCLFTEDCFRVHRYDIDSPNHSYKDFMSLKNEDQTTAESARKKVDHRYVPWDILVRGTNNGVNKLLDWIELGMTDALSRKYLKTLQLSVYDGEVSPSNRIEAYVMEFFYTEDGVAMELSLSGARGLPSPPGKPISSAKQELRYLVHRLANHIGGFPELCPRSIINMHFTYTDACPAEYQPPGFVICEDHGLVLRSNEGALVGSIHPGPHRVDLRVLVKENELELAKGPNPLTMVTLRGSTGSTRLTRSPVVKDGEPTLTQETRQVEEMGSMANLHPTQEQHDQASMVSNATGALDTQERAQLAAIDSMARLRSARNDPHDTQILDVVTLGVNNRYGSVAFDAESTAVDGSSTQGTPSTVGGRRSARLSALRSTTNSPPRDTVVMLRPRKRQPTFEKEQHTLKLRKVSEARSPFASSSSLEG